ncbi:hypothetical protein [Wenjunlia tyrosinilytica]|uniref:Uncharacterized protein n=1 Tax=Wenjunlia tyrosinilytica TaxID=1544741 RepID=A0A917ZVT3_9ACTN|nr:hypothetical protein [Wenjunlia tyrosinilytica]GGO96657.1 hypothetical protein GCM10012280_56660 [Wenjunlia tyrosinilytica]
MAVVAARDANHHAGPACEGRAAKLLAHVVRGTRVRGEAAQASEFA